MYQFYYAISKNNLKHQISNNINQKIEIKAIRPAMWEEHCLECSAPLCYKSCIHYIARKDGRCQRLKNGFATFEDKSACCGQGAHVSFRQWANMMTIIFDGLMPVEEYKSLFKYNQKLGSVLKAVVNSNLPVKLKWEVIRTVEYLRRRKLRRIKMIQQIPDAFVFHGFSYQEKQYRLIIEIYSEHQSVFKTSIMISSGENMHIIKKEDLSPECWKFNNLVKIYPENNLEVELDVLWCDFVSGDFKDKKYSEKIKCVVWDLDNTVWDGILIEQEKTDDLKLKPHVLDVIQELDRRGIIQSIASKNDEKLAWPVLQRMKIDEYFLYPQIHWNVKSSSIEQIARELNIGIDSFAFIDDSVFERKQVKSVLPQVRVFDEKDVLSILDREEFQGLVTEESKNRRNMYRAEEHRNELKKIGNDENSVFVKKCHLKLFYFVPTTENELTRAYELLVRTNQLNMSGIKYTQVEFEQVINRPNHFNFGFSCEDDFGKYGIVGFGQYTIINNNMVITEFAMSCRVAGKYIENSLFYHLLEMTQLKKGEIHIHKNKKNSLLYSSLLAAGFTCISDSEKEADLIFDSSLKYNDVVEFIKEKE